MIQHRVDSGIDVSIVIAARNEATHLRAALNSIAQQHDVRHEIIFVDDHSEDDTFRIATEVADMHEKIRVLQSPRRGKCAAFNFGVSVARGRFICLFAGDDIMPHGSLKARLDSVVGAGDEQFVVGLSKIKTMSSDRRYDGHLVPRAVGRGATSGVSPLMSQRVAGIIFPVPEQLPNEDTWMELAVLHMPGWRIVHSDVVCCLWRVHAGNSINYTVPFREFNKKITVRMDALMLFMEKFERELSADQREVLAAKIRLERARRAGQWWRVLAASAPLMDRLRALAATNAFMYEIRKRLYGLLSGW